MSVSAENSRQKFPWWRRNKFFDTTDVAGFGLIHAANSKFEIVMWYIIVSICTIITVHNVTNLLSQYWEGGTVTSMEIGRSDTALFPNMTICVQLKLPEVYPEFQRSKKGVNKLLQNISSVRVDVGKALKKYPNKALLLDRDWDYVLIPLVYRYFSAMRLLEVNPALLNPELIIDSHARVLKAFLTNKTAPEIAESIYSILRYTRKLGVTDGELFDKLGVELAKIADFKINYSERNLAKVKTWPLQPKLYLLGFKISTNVVHQFCFGYIPRPRMGKDRIHLVDVIPRLDFKMDLEERDEILKEKYGFTMDTLLKSFSTMIGGKYGEEEVEKLDVLLGDEYGVRQFLGYSELTAQVSKTVRAHVTTEAYYNMKTNCSLNETQEQCVLRCKSTVIQTACQCTPVLVIPTLNGEDRHGLRFCTLDEYLSGCLNVEMVGKYNQCIEKRCISPCNHATSDMEVHTLRKYANYSQAKIYINREESEYPIFIENDAQSFESFFGELGGTLDFYLGVSVIAILHMIFFLVKQVYYCLTGNKKPEEDGYNNRDAEESISLAETDAVSKKLSNARDVVRSVNYKIDQLEAKFDKRLSHLEIKMAKMLTMLTNNQKDADSFRR